MPPIPPVSRIFTARAPNPIPGIYSQAVRAGNNVYCSGFVGMTQDNKLVEGSVQDRTRQVIKNLDVVLQEAGLSLGHVVKANIYLTNVKQDFGPFNEVWKEMMPDPKPARTCVGVAYLPGGGTDVEIEFVACDG